ncbi:putative RNA helicase [Rosa chinensis]|uniref:RNA helicase n=1 Tax=Rosa chinensis TaxID=74649 RepID=A0A2P6S4K8_ROSCH|nr:putative RNA helicase [Rosa chinensis]
MNAGCAAVSLSENDIIYTYDTSLRENTNILCTSSVNDDSESTNSMVHIGQDKIKESPKPNTSWENELADFPALSFLKDSKNGRHISRPREVIDARNDIPIVMMEQEIMEAINEHSTVIIRGETGCGKTTQVPQFLYEVGIGSSGCPLGSGIIGVTQPRCIAVTATAKRVAYELGLQLGEEVGFQYRYDKKIGESCSIKFMTDGILL